MNDIEAGVLDPKAIKDKCKMLPSEAKIFIIEYVVPLIDKEKLGSNALLKMFDDFIFVTNNQIFHSVNRNTVCDTNYYDFNINSKKGSFRCNESGGEGNDNNDNDNKGSPPEFKDCENHGTILSQLNNMIAERLEQRGVTLPYGVVQDCTFKIADNTTAKFGTACSNPKVWTDEKLKKVCKDLNPDGVKECDVMKTITNSRTKETTNVLDRSEMCGRILPDRFKKANKFVEWPA
jgi:hypothetical protein